MKIDASLPPVPLNSIPAIAQIAESLGFDALWGSETMHDPFLAGVLAAEHTRRLAYGTAVAIAFARSPGNLAYTAWDLAQQSGGRFILGLGTQVKAHIVRRFGMPWPDSVVGHLRELIQAVRAIWNCWQTGEPLDFHSATYKLNLMTPFFNPGPIEHPHIPIFIAGVNSGLARLAGELADGFVVHPFHSPQYLQQVLLPAIQAGAQKSGRSRDKIQISTTAFAVTSPEEENFVRMQISFYASTPSYRAVMDFHGWGEIAGQLSPLAARGRWMEMPGLISDEMLKTFAVVCEAEALPGKLRERYDGLADRLGLYLPLAPGESDNFWQRFIAGIKA
jgi:probable F420-dependent oxidoreductase